MSDLLLIYYLLIVGLLVGYGFLCYGVVKYTRKHTINLPIFRLLIVRSCVYSLFFGIGVIGEPGAKFALIAPNIIAAGFMVYFSIDLIYSLPAILFWWFVIFVILLAKD